MQVPVALVPIPLAMLALGAALRAQCSNVWLPGESLPGVNGVVHATATWDPDGSGPLPAELVVGGSFTIAGDGFRANIARVDRATGSWSGFGTGTNGVVRALAVLANGELVAAGEFTQAGGVAVSRIARWTGTTWAPLGSGCDAEVVALCRGPGGTLVATGAFMIAGGVVAHRIATWDGANWSACGTGLDAAGAAIATHASGDVVVGGSFTTAGGVVANGVARWDGAAWAAYGNGAGAGVRAIAVAPNGSVAAAGFTQGAIQLWDGTTWTSLPQAHVVGTAVTFLANGDLLAYGTLPYGSGLLSRWNGTWTTVASPWLVHTLRTEANGTVVLGGQFRLGGGCNLATWDGTSFAAVGPGFDHGATAVCALPDGGMVVAGDFLRAGAAAASAVARWDGTAWSALGAAPNAAVFAVTALPDGDIVAGGAFTQIGGIAADRVARWNGSTWSAIGAGLGGWVSALATMPDGHPVAAARISTLFMTSIVRWDGSAWQPLGAATNHVVHDLLVLPNGDVIAAGEFTAIGSTAVNRIARWDGTAWTPLGNFPGGRVFGLARRPNGDLIAGSDSNVWRWDGVAWSIVGNTPYSSTTAVLALPNGDVIAAGTFQQVGGQPANRIARWDGTSWRPFGAGLDYGAADLARLANGDLVVVGSFLTADGAVSPSVARLSTTCPATVVPFGAGCVGNGGQNTLTATALPWLGATYRAEASGMPASGFVVAVTGFTPLALSLASVFAQALPGCQGLVTPDAVELLLPVVGRAQTQLTIPSTPGLAGFVVHQYVVAFELGGLGQLAAITSSNALTLQLGSF